MGFREAVSVAAENMYGAGERVLRRTVELQLNMMSS